MILTQSEFDTQKDKLLRKFAQAQVDAANRRVWRISPTRGTPDMHARLLWLFVYALNGYEHNDGVVNYLTETQVHRIFAKSNTL